MKQPESRYNWFRVHYYEHGSNEAKVVFHINTDVSRAVVISSVWLHKAVMSGWSFLSATNGNSLVEQKSDETKPLVRHPS